MKAEETVAQEGAPDFSAYFRDQYPRILRELELILSDREAAKELAQEAFIRQYASWRRLSRYDKPGAWVRRVAIRLAVKFRQRAFSVPFQVTGQDDAIPASPSVQVDVVLDVRAAVAQLPPAQRAAVVLHYYRDLPVVLVADALGCRESTAKVHLHKARQKLAVLLHTYAPS